MKSIAENPVPFRVLLTDYPWPDVTVERQIIESAGFELVTGESAAGSIHEIERLVEKVNPHAILTCWAPVSAKAIAQPDDLQIVARMGVGLDNIDVGAATRRGAWVTNVPDYCVEEVSDHALALALASARGLIRLNSRAKEGLFTPGETELRRVSDLCVGIIGFGRIGRRTAQKFHAFGCRVLVNNDDLASLSKERLPQRMEVATLETIQLEADVIVLHPPLTPSTEKMIGTAFISGCKRAPFLINVSRGGLVDNEALVDGLNKGLLGGAALDVIDGEPHPPLSLIQRSDVIVTPHIAYRSDASLLELRRRSCEEVVRVLKHGLPQHPCNRPTSIQSAHEVEETPLTGGVASDIRIVHAPEGAYVVKQALRKLRVSADWFSDPSRSSIEAAGLEVIANLLSQGSVPKVLWKDAKTNQFAMELIDARFKNWKSELLQGRANADTAASAGRLLGTLHKKSSLRPEFAKQFDNTQPFIELRIRPFFDRVAERNPALAPLIADVVSGMSQGKMSLVHGDYSPKNLLADGGDVVILDCEVMHWGDPRFDVAFCVTHLCLKSFLPGAPVAAVFNSIFSFLREYKRHGLPVLDQRFRQLVGCLMLARLEGDSPVEYLGRLDLADVKNLACKLISDSGLPLESALTQILESA